MMWRTTVRIQDQYLPTKVCRTDVRKAFIPVTSTSLPTRGQGSHPQLLRERHRNYRTRNHFHTCLPPSMGNNPQRWCAQQLPPLLFVREIVTSQETEKKQPKALKLIQENVNKSVKHSVCDLKKENSASLKQGHGVHDKQCNRQIAHTLKNYTISFVGDISRSSNPFIHLQDNNTKPALQKWQHQKDFKKQNTLTS